MNVPLISINATNIDIGDETSFANVDLFEYDKIINSFAIK